jgi:3-isopropylmalate/(R)-2-methylmalate dehydratase small subunit
VIAPGFADIFFSNCHKNGLLPVALPADVVEQLFAAVARDPALALTVDLPAQRVHWVGGEAAFAIDALRKQKLIEGRDEIGDTLMHADAIRVYEERRRREAPWLFGAP